MRALILGQGPGHRVKMKSATQIRSFRSARPNGLPDVSVSLKSGSCVSTARAPLRSDDAPRILQFSQIKPESENRSSPRQTPKSSLGRWFRLNKLFLGHAHLKI